MNQSTGRPPREPPLTPSIDCTKSPPKRVATLALRCSTRMTVSSPATFARGRSTSARAPKSRVTVSPTPPSGAAPGPTPQPPATAAAAATSSAANPVLADIEDDAVAAAAARVVAVEGLVDRVDVEHVVPARKRARQQVGRVLAVADGEPEPVGGTAAARAAQALELAAEVRAAAAVVAGEAQLDRQQAGRVGRDVQAQRARPLAAGE